MEATPAKLRDGSWGARVVTNSISVGDEITVRTKSGKTWQARVERVLWSGDDKRTQGRAHLVQTKRNGNNDARSSGGYRRRGRGWETYNGIEIACGYPCPVDGHTCTPSWPCHDCL